MGQKYRARTALLVLLALLALVWAGRPRAAAAADDDAALANGLQTLVGHVDAASAALARGDIADARAAYTQFDNGWFDIEDGVRERSRDSYRAIERAMDDVQFGLRPDQPDVAAVQGSLGVLRQQVTAFIATLGAAPTTADAPAPPGAAAPADEATTAARDALRPWAAHVDAALSRLNAGDLAGADREFESFRTAWPDIEDAIRPVSRPHYREIERAMGDARAAFSAQPADAAAVREPLQRLQVATSSFLAGTPLPADANEATTSPSVANATPATLLSLLDQVLAALDRGDVAAARTQLRTFQDVWLDVEGLVMTRSRSVYVDTENRTAEAAAALNAQPADVAGARAAVTAMRADLVPIAEAGSSYGMWDAAIILFREGFEALLVVAALVAFLQRSGNGDKRRWIWAGGAAGIAASIGVAILAQLVLNRAIANVSREIIEGATGLIAAAMLLYVGYWLHSKASLAGWQEYIRVRSTAALQRNSLFGLAFIAFLAVFREGAETVLFYVGIAPSISTGDLLAGLGIGAGGLVVLALIMLVGGVRLPIRPFFLAATVLIYYLCIKFVGTGIHSLQVSSVLPATPAPWVPSSDLFGLFPTWETTVAQLAVLLLILGWELAPRLLHHRAAPAAAR
ncbi:MAG TPA: FTR1 family protein [Chloroflexota bacterium]|nr:FTR1 family protein [Chloroflexota bacterium]